MRHRLGRHLDAERPAGAANNFPANALVGTSDQCDRQPAAAAKAGAHVSGARAAALQTKVYDHALATGFSRGYLVSAGILALAAIIALAVIRVTRQDLSGADPAPEPAGDTISPGRA
jgi:hypothetical protein